MTRRTVLIVAGCIVALVVVARLAVGLLFDGYYIPSMAMEPTLTVGDRVLARSIDGADVQVGDIVVYVSEFERISRVAGVGGDRIDVDGEEVDVPPGHVFVVGDNRGNSQDSRLLGSIPIEDVRALVVLRWWPLPPDSLNR